jgi:hypothetical protein
MLEQYQPDPNRGAILRLMKLLVKISESVSSHGGNALVVRSTQQQTDPLPNHDHAGSDYRGISHGAVTKPRTCVVSLLSHHFWPSAWRSIRPPWHAPASPRRHRFRHPNRPCPTQPLSPEPQ